MIGTFGLARTPQRRLALVLMVAGAALCPPAWPIGHLSHEELGRLLKVVDKQGSHVTIPRAVASILELKPGQYTPDIKEAAYLDDQSTRHGFGPLNDGSGFFMFSGGALGQVVYVVDPDLRLVHAAQSLIKNGPLISLPEAEAQRSLDEEFRQWSKVLSPDGPSAPKPFPFKGSGPAKTRDVPPEPYPFPPSAPKQSGADK